MSFKAMAWAIGQDIPRTAEKFLLVMLANYANDEGICYPSLERLATELSQDRKTVIKSIKSLIKNGLLKDTGKRVGSTKSVVVYQLVGLPSISKFHYLYKVSNTETGEYYIGTRSTDCLPHMDLNYMGSGEWPRKMKEENVFLLKEILEVFVRYEDCVSAENRFLRSMIRDDGLCKNLQTSYQARRRSLENLDKNRVVNSRYEAVPFFPSSSAVFGGQNL